VFDHNQPNFADRHIGPDADAVATMLKTIGVGSLDELADKALPAGILDALSDTASRPAWIAVACRQRAGSARRTAPWRIPTRSRCR
jgi:glycine cleavage system pyridoxal-binding protein P